jgi:hypothetical protein
VIALIDFLGHSKCPDGVLKYDAISVTIFESGAFPVPIGIEGRNWRIAMLSHARDGSIPIGAIGKVEGHKVILGRRSACIVSTRVSELEMVRLPRPTKHDAVETGMVLEAIEFLQTESVPIKANHGVKIVRGSGDAKYSWRFHY